MELKAIETVYGGYRFRSRLEARWAVFFDVCEIPYQYEPEGFVLDDGTCYLPDFYLPWFECYVEIKPKGYEQVDEAKRKLERLFYGLEDKTVMLCQGDPLDNDMQAFVYRHDDNNEKNPVHEFVWKSVRFLKGLYGYNTYHARGIIIGGKDIGRWSEDKDKVFLGGFEPTDWNNWYTTADDSHGKLACYPMGDTYALNDFKTEKEIARETRFEYGEVPDVGGCQ